MNAETVAWICADCAQAAGGHQCTKVACWHDDVCGVCGDLKPVTQPRDYAWPEAKGTKGRTGAK